MKDIKFILVLLLGLLLASAASPAASVEQLKGWLAANGLDPDDFEKLRVFANAKGELVSWSWDANKVGIAPPAESELPAAAASSKAASSYRADKIASAEDARQDAKSKRLKAAEKKLIEFLRGEGAVKTNAKSATAEEIDAMYASWEANLNDSQLEKKSTKYTRLLEQVERAGGTELDSRWRE